MSCSPVRALCEWQGMPSTVSRAGGNSTQPFLPVCIVSPGQPEMRACKVISAPVHSFLQVHNLLDYREYEVVYLNFYGHLIPQLFLSLAYICSICYLITQKSMILNNFFFKFYSFFFKLPYWKGFLPWERFNSE